MADGTTIEHDPGAPDNDGDTANESSHGTAPDLVPARMVNEFAYCPRLFHLEWVQSRWADNLDTVEGRWHHRSVDDEAGAAPLPGEGEFRVARSLSLSSPTLGLVAKVDLAEAGEGGRVVPVETKRGRPAPTPERVWEPERVQLCVQGLLLREAGYQVDFGEVFFAETRERVRVDFDRALVAHTLELVAELRQVATDDQAPSPLVDSHKCPRCSLVGICLPDELNTLAVRSARPPRRLVTRDPDARPLYVSEQGAYVGKKGGRVEVRLDGTTVASARAIDVSQVCVYGNVQVGTQALRELFARDVPVLWFSYGGWFQGMAHGLPAKNVDLRTRQVVTATRRSGDIARQMVEGKVRNARTMLRRNSRERPAATLDQLRLLAEQAAATTSPASLLGVEGTAARIYFRHFATMVRPGCALPGGTFDFDGRNRRPPRDAVNCLLSFAYSLLVKDLTVVLTAIGFDPYLGFYHRPRFGRPALALDLAEEFRPIVADSVVIGAINNGEVSPSSFVTRAGGVALTKAGRRAVIAAYERRLDQHARHPIFGYQVSYRRLYDLQARLLAAHVLGEVPEYIPFTTR